MKQQSWKPNLRGKIYCAPACGGGCTKTAYDNAVRAANDLVERLRGSGWTPVIHENLGWHYRAVSGPVQVYGTSDNRFWCLVGSNPKDSAGGLAVWSTDAKTFKDPNHAVRAAIARVREVVERYTETLKVAEVAAGVCP